MSNYQDRMTNISPLDGRYRKACDELRYIFSEGGLTKYRLRVEIRYLKRLIEFLCNNYDNDFIRSSEFLESDSAKDVWERLRILDLNLFGDRQKAIETIFKTEETLRHDVKSVECCLREYLRDIGETHSISNKLIEFVHFGLTSQDITTLAVWMQIRDGIEVIKNNIIEIEDYLRSLYKEYKDYPLLSLTHGQPATPTTMGKEIMVFAERLHHQLERLPNSVNVKFGGCIGNLNAHHITFPSIGRKWLDFADNFVHSMNDNYKIVQFKRAQFTTQIDHYDDMACVFDNVRRMNVVCVDLCRDMWSYISRNVFKLAIVEGEVGSSTMPHKVNPIDFENAEGNLLLGNAIFDFLSNKLPISRLQRDLTDSTVVRNIGMAFAYSLVAYKSILKGLDKIDINYDVTSRELKNNTVVIAEAIQQILRSAGVEGAYDKVKELTRKHPPPTMFDVQEFIMDLDLDKLVIDRLLQIKPESYTGIFPKDYKEEYYDPTPIHRSTEKLSFEVSKHLLETALKRK